VSRITAAFDDMRAAGRVGLVTYVTAGDPDLETSGRVLAALARGGADVIEVGVPFSDPVADGPAIQRASERALAAGGHLGASLDLVRSLRASVDTPVVVFSYVNPVLRLGLDRFADEAREAGVDGVLLLDLPIEEAGLVRGALDARGLDQIFLVSPTTSDARLREAGRLGRGFLYVISRLGVTGTRDAVAEGARPLVERVRAAASLPVALGFGLSRPEHIAEVAGFADAAVVGSAIVETIERASTAGGDVPAAVEKFVRSLAHGRHRRPAPAH
jgi:tryptophan synthase alpha chain